MNFSPSSTTWNYASAAFVASTFTQRSVTAVLATGGMMCDRSEGYGAMMATVVGVELTGAPLRYVKKENLSVWFAYSVKA